VLNTVDPNISAHATTAIEQWVRDGRFFYGAVRNYLVLHTFVRTRTNVGYIFWLGNHLRASGGVADASDPTSAHSMFEKAPVELRERVLSHPLSTPANTTFHGANPTTFLCSSSRYAAAACIRRASCVWRATLTHSPFRSHRGPFCFRSTTIFNIWVGLVLVTTGSVNTIRKDRPAASSLSTLRHHAIAKTLPCVPCRVWTAPSAWPSGWRPSSPCG